MKILLLFFLSGILLQGLKVLLNYIMTRMMDFDDKIILLTSGETDSVNLLSAERTDDVAGSTGITLPKETHFQMKRLYPGTTNIKLSNSEPLGVEFFTQPPLNQTA